MLSPLKSLSSFLAMGFACKSEYVGGFAAFLDAVLSILCLSENLSRECFSSSSSSVLSNQCNESSAFNVTISPFSLKQSVRKLFVNSLAQGHAATFMMNIICSLQQAIYTTKLRINFFVFFRRIIVYFTRVGF